MTEILLIRMDWGNVALVCQGRIPMYRIGYFREFQEYFNINWC